MGQVNVDTTVRLTAPAYPCPPAVMRHRRIWPRARDLPRESLSAVTRTVAELTRSRQRASTKEARAQPMSRTASVPDCQSFSGVVFERPSDDAQPGNVFVVHRYRPGQLRAELLALRHRAGLADVRDDQGIGDDAFRASREAVAVGQVFDAVVPNTARSSQSRCAERPTSALPRTGRR